MNIREVLGRFLNETEQVISTRRYKWLCSIALILTLAGIFHLFDGDFWKVRRLQKDIEEVAPQWEVFKRANPGFDFIVFFASRDEAYGAKLKARGTLSVSREKQLYEFVASTKLSPYPFDTQNVRFRLEYGPTAEEMERRIKNGKLDGFQNGSEQRRVY
ncbi:hypothetical protein OAM01_02145 [bacterium]|nr:hypothetical protein [bacterium]